MDWKLVINLTIPAFSMAAASGKAIALPTWRYWRIYVTANNGDTYTSLQEVEIRGSIGGADLTTPGTPYAQSGSADPAYHAGWLIDNEAAPDYCWVVYGGEVWCYFDLGTARGVAEIAMWSQTAGASMPYRAPKDFLIQGSNDTGTTKTWSTIKTLTSITGWTAGTPKTFALI